MFIALLSVNGVDPKSRLQLSAMSVADLQQAVEFKRVDTLQSVPGIGRKTAEKILLELRGKVHATADVLFNASCGAPQEYVDDLRSALANLGYKERDVATVVAKAAKDFGGGDFSDLVKQALALLQEKPADMQVLF